jgi:hypothetical protein
MTYRVKAVLSVTNDIRGQRRMQNDTENAPGKRVYFCSNTAELVMLSP